MSEKPDMNDYGYPEEDHPDHKFWVETLWDTWIESHKECPIEAERFIFDCWRAGTLRLIVDTNILRKKYYDAGGEFFGE